MRSLVFVHLYILKGYNCFLVLTASSADLLKLPASVALIKVSICGLYIKSSPINFDIFDIFDIIIYTLFFCQTDKKCKFFAAYLQLKVIKP